MKTLFTLLALFSSLSALAQTTESTSPHLEDLIPLRSCVSAVSILITGKHIPEGWSSPGENSFYFLNCDDDYDQGQDHYVFTASGIYYFFIKAHRDYKSGMDATQFRLSLESKTYYFTSNAVGGMRNLFDDTGKNLDTDETNQQNLTIDPSAKNVVLNYYMKTLTGNSDLKSTILAEPASAERLMKAQACMQKRIIQLGSSLAAVYKARRDFRQVSQEVLTGYQATALRALTTPVCSLDPKISEKFNLLVNEINK